MNRSRIQTLLTSSTTIFSVINLISGLQDAYHLHRLHLADVKGLVLLTLSGLLYLTKDKSVTGEQTRETGAVATTADLIASVRSGVLGGLLGGLAGGLPVAFYYYFTALTSEGQGQNRVVFFLVSVAQIVVYSLLVGVMIGLFVRTFLYASKNYQGFREIAVGSLGGAVAGCVVGLIAGYAVGLRNTDAISYGWLIGTATFGAAWIACGNLIFEYKLNRLRAASALAIVFLIEIVIAFAGAQMLAYSGIDLTSPTNSAMALNVGGEVGLICGALLGIQITATQVVYRFLNDRNVEEPSTRKKQTRGDKRSRKRRR